MTDERRDDAIAAVEQIILRPDGAVRNGCVSTRGPRVMIDGVQYSTVHSFKSKQSQVYKDVIFFLEQFKINYKVEVVYRQWAFSRFKQIDVTILDSIDSDKQNDQ
jgi:hypothetical protein